MRVPQGDAQRRRQRVALLGTERHPTPLEPRRLAHREGRGGVGQFQGHGAFAEGEVEGAPLGRRRGSPGPRDLDGFPQKLEAVPIRGERGASDIAG